MVQHRSANLKVWGSIPHGDSEVFFVPQSWQDEKTSFLILHRAQNTPIDFGDASGILTFVIFPAHRRVLVAQWYRIGAQIWRSEVRFLMGTQTFSSSHAREKTKNIFLNSSPHSKHTNRLWWYKQYAGRVSLELCNSPCSPKSLCGSVVQNRSANPKVWDSIPHGDSEFYFVTHLWQDEKTSLLILHIPIDFGDTSGMQDACHQNFVIVPAHRRVFVAQWHSIGAQIRRSEVRFFMGTQNITLSHARDKTKTFFSIRHRAQNIPIDFGDTSGIQDACH